jgi:DNA polymerase III subunit delta'
MNKRMFSDVIGHKAACDVFLRQLEAERLAHAYLFIGPEHVGRTVFATKLLNELFAKHKGSLASHADVRFVTRAVDEKTGKEKQQISVKQIRELREHLSMSAIDGGWKAVFIEEADKLNIAASNALLKTLEEPSGKTIIILRAPSMESVLPTIASRCQIMRFHLVSKQEIEKALKKRGLSPVEAKRYSALSSGRPGWALRLVTDSAFRAEMETAVHATLEQLNSSLSGRLKSVQNMLPKDEVNKITAARLVMDRWEQVIRDILLVQCGNEKHATHQEALEEISAVAKTRSRAQWLKILLTISESRQALAQNTNPQIALEHILITL